MPHSQMCQLKQRLPLFDVYDNVNILAIQPAIWKNVLQYKYTYDSSHWNVNIKEIMKKSMGVDGWMDGWMELANAVLRIAYSNKNMNSALLKFSLPAILERQI